MQNTHPHPDSVVTPDQWCVNCGSYRAAEADGRYGDLCPVCQDKAGVAVASRNGYEATMMVLDEAATFTAQALSDSGMSAVQAGLAFRVLAEEVSEDGARLITNARLTSYCVMNEELVCAQPAPFIDNVRQCCIDCPYSTALTVVECNECAEGIAHHHNGTWLACIERCPGCAMCPLPGSDDS